MSGRALLIALVIAVATTTCVLGCAEEQEPPLVARRAFMPYRMDVYPVLLADCGFPACHGAPERFFRVYGPVRAHS